MFTLRAPAFGRLATGVVAFRIITRREGYRPRIARRSPAETLDRERSFLNLDTAIGRRRARRGESL
jgi:hypothetical protein